MGDYRIFAINPGSTTTKIGLFEGEVPLFMEKADHSASELAGFKNLDDQLEYRKDAIVRIVREKGYDLNRVDAFSGRGGGLKSMEGGVYSVNDVMLEDGRTTKFKHPAVLGPRLAHLFAREYGGKAFIVNPPDVDEMEDVARITGLKGIYRGSQFHALNQKEIAIRAAADMGKRYEQMNFIVAHIGGGVSITAHKKGRAVDTTSNIIGNGPMMPTRAGELPTLPFLDLCFSGGNTRDELYSRIVKTGGLIDHLGSSDMLEIHKRIKDGDTYAELVFSAFVYQLAKNISSMAAVFCGEVDAIILTGGIARDAEVVETLKKMVGFIAPVKIYPGELELEALACGVLRILRGQEAARDYTGVPVFKGFQ
jgi:butyrate kinase